MNDATISDIRAALNHPRPPPGMTFVLGLSILHMEVLKGTMVEVVDRNYEGAWGECRMILQDTRTGQKYEYSLKTLARESKNG